jgi:hypothetical protein
LCSYQSDDLSPFFKLLCLAFYNFFPWLNALCNKPQVFESITFKSNQKSPFIIKETLQIIFFEQPPMPSENSFSQNFNKYQAVAVEELVP